MTAKSPPTPAPELPPVLQPLEQGPSGIPDSPSDSGEQFKVKAKFRTLRMVNGNIVERRYFDGGCYRETTYPAGLAKEIFT